MYKEHKYMKIFIEVELFRVHSMINHLMNCLRRFLKKTHNFQEIFHEFSWVFVSEYQDH
jgi:hypothetical protein